MADDEGPKPRPSYPPKKPLKPTGDPRPTRRQMLASFLGGGALLGCGSDGTTPPDGGGGAPAAGGATGGAATGGNGAGGQATGGQATGGNGAGGRATGGNGAGGQATGGNGAGGQATGGQATGGQASGGEGQVEEGSGGTEAGKNKQAHDLVPLGNTGILVSRLAMGSGSTGYDGSSQQTRMGTAFSDLLVESYGLGIKFWETADAYGSHGVVGEAARRVGRENVVLMTKTMATTKAECEADLARFMDELGTDYIDIVLLHIRTSPDWASEGAGAMEALAEAKARGQIGAHGVSCHSLAALQLAASLDWVDVHLARINPFQLHMDSDPATIISLLEGEKAKGKGVIGMKILAQGDAVDQLDRCIEHATKLNALDCFTIGFTSRAQLDEIVQKIGQVSLG